MAKVDFLTAKLSQRKSLPDEYFDNLTGPPVGFFFSPEEQSYIKKLILKNRGDIKLKLLNAFMKSKGFSRLSAGTNRVVYRFLDDTSFVMKIALDRVGMQDSLLEFKNQRRLKPYVCKIFDVTPDGLMATIERVLPISSKEEFEAVQEEIYWLIVTKIIGKYVAEDIGKSYIRNYGIRPQFGVVLLDYPYIYPVAEEKLYCTNVSPINGQRCTGMIDYDDGFNHLFCRKCGKRYLAADLEDKNAPNDIIINRGGRFQMKVAVVNSDGSRYEPIMSSSVIERRTENKKANNNKQLKVAVVTNKVDKKGNIIEPVESVTCGETKKIDVKVALESANMKTDSETTKEIAEYVEKHDEVTPIEVLEVENPIQEESDMIAETQTIEVTDTTDSITATVTESSSSTEVSIKDPSTPTVEEAPKVEETKGPARDASGRFVKKSNSSTEKFVAEIEAHGTEKYPKSKKAGGAKKAGKTGKANVNSKFIPSPGTK